MTAVVCDILCKHEFCVSFPCALLTVQMVLLLNIRAAFVAGGVCGSLAQCDLCA
jgi:hypothetical protein